MSFKDKYSFWIDRKVDGFVYRFSEYEIRNHAVGGPEHWVSVLECTNPRDCARAWRIICDKAEKEKANADV